MSQEALPPLDSVTRAPDPAVEGRPVIIAACIGGLALAVLLMTIDLILPSRTTSVLAPWPSRQGLVNPLSYHILAVEEALVSKHHHHHRGNASSSDPHDHQADAVDGAGSNDTTIKTLEDRDSVPEKEPEPPASAAPSPSPTSLPTRAPTAEPSASPSSAPTFQPTSQPTAAPSASPTQQPTPQPTRPPDTAQPTARPTPTKTVPEAHAAMTSGDGTACPSALAQLSHSCLQRAHEAQGGKKAWDGGVVDVWINGDMANQIFDVVFGIIVADLMGYRPRIPNIMHSDDAEATAEVSKDGCVEWTSVDQMKPEVCDSLVTAFSKASEPGHCVVIHDGYWQRYAMYQPFKERVKHLMHSPQWDDGPRPANPGPNDVVIHVRWWPSRTDLPIQTLEGVRQDLFYPALTWEYYEAVLGRMQPWDNLWVVCMEELVQSPLVQKLVSTYGAKVQSGDREDDFNFLKRADRLIMGASTFSWWAAFLSKAREVHYPLAGFLHPYARMPDFESQVPGELTVYDEERYIYHDVLQNKWWGRFDQCTNSFVYRYEDEGGDWKPDWLQAKDGGRA